MLSLLRQQYAAVPGCRIVRTLQLVVGTVRRRGVINADDLVAHAGHTAGTRLDGTCQAFPRLAIYIVSRWPAIAYA